MSGSFELDPPGPLPGEPAHGPGPVRRSRRAARRSKAPRTAATSPSWPLRLGTPFVASASYYVLALLLAGGMLLALYNPDFGALAERWPHELFRGAAAWSWTATTLPAVCLVVAAVAYLVALVLPAGRARGVLAAAATVVALAPWTPAGDAVRAHVLPLAVALAAGALLAAPNPGGEAGRKATLLVGAALLAAHLFLPTPGTAAYHPVAFATLDAFRDLSAGAAAVAALVVPTAAALVLVVALLALSGLAGRWARWTAGIVLVAMSLAWAVATYAGAEDVQGGLRALALAGHAAPTLFALPLAAAVADLVRGRRAPAG